MKKSGKKFLSLFISLCLVMATIGISSTSPISSIAQAQTKEELEEQLQEIDATLNKLKSEQSDTQSYLNTLDQKLTYLKQQLTIIKQEVADTKEKIQQTQIDIEENAKAIETTQVEIEDLTSQTQKLNEEFSSTYESYCKRIRALYVSGETSSMLAFLLDSDGVENLLTRLEMVATISRKDGKLMETVKNQSNEIISNKNELTQKQQDLITSQTKLEENTESLKVQQLNLASQENEMTSKQATIEDQQQEANALLLKLNQQTDEYSEFHDMTQADIDAIDKAIAEAEEKYTTTTTTTTEKTTSSSRTTTTATQRSQSNYIDLIYPCPSYTVVTCGFGDYYGHTGCDFSTGGKTGYKVVAADSGTVIISRDITCNRSTCSKSYHGGGYCSYGRYIVIRHDNPTRSGKTVYTVYAHNSSRLVSEGEHVSQGEQIALSGSTGNSTGPHVHFEVRVGGSSQSYAVDPENYF